MCGGAAGAKGAVKRLIYGGILVQNGWHVAKKGRAMSEKGVERWRATAGHCGEDRGEDLNLDGMI